MAFRASTESSEIHSERNGRQTHSKAQLQKRLEIKLCHPSKATEEGETVN
jgi:hypothetical protein